MKITETTPPPTKRTFRLDLDEDEIGAIRYLIKAAPMYAVSTPAPEGTSVKVNGVNMTQMANDIREALRA